MENRIEVADVLYVNVPYCWSQDCAFIIYDSFVLGGLDRSSELIPISEKSLEEYWHTSGDWGFRLFRDGQYLDTVSYYGFDETWLRDMVTESNNPARTDSMLVNIDYERERFEGLAVNDGEPLTFGPKIPLTSESEGYVDFIAKILADNGLVGEPVHIREIVKTDLEGDGIDEVLIVASNIDAPDQNKGQYSIVLLRKVIDGKVESLFLTKQIKNMLPGDWNDRLLYDYALREIVDLDHDGVCELLLSETYYEGRFYLIYKLVDGEMQLILENGFGL